MKKFSLEEFKKNPNRKVVTRDGHSVRIICTDVMGDYPVVGLIMREDNREITSNFKKDGTYLTDKNKCWRDLFFEPEKKEGWVNVYRHSENYIRTGVVIFKTKEGAMEGISVINGDKYVDTIHIEWEE